MSEVKLCKDCRFSQNGEEYSYCLHPQSPVEPAKISLITGSIEAPARSYYCQTMRMNSSKCKQEALLFELKEPKKSFLKINAIRIAVYFLFNIVPIIVIIAWMFINHMPWYLPFAIGALVEPAVRQFIRVCRGKNDAL